MLICSGFLSQRAATHGCCKWQKKEEYIKNSHELLGHVKDTWLLGNSVGRDIGARLSFCTNPPLHLIWNQQKKGSFLFSWESQKFPWGAGSGNRFFPSAVPHHCWRMILLMCWGFAFFKYHWYLFSLLALNSNEAEVSSVPWWGIYPKKASRNVRFLGLQTSFHLSSIPSVCLAAPPPLPSSSLWSQPPRPVKWTFS